MNIKYLPKESRPREKLLTRGVKALSDAELLAIFLRTGIKGKNAVELAAYLLSEFGSLKNLFASTKETFCEHKGLGEAKYAQMQAVLEMAHRYLAESIKRGDALNSSYYTKQYLTSVLRNRERESFVSLYLNNQNQVIGEEVLFEGTINAASIYPREIVKGALAHNAAAVILAHNHPSGISEPSQSDIRVTKKIKEALALIDIRVLDHFIIADESVLSFAEQGLI